MCNSKILLHLYTTIDFAKSAQLIYLGGKKTHEFHLESLFLDKIVTRQIMYLILVQMVLKTN